MIYSRVELHSKLQDHVYMTITIQNLLNVVYTVRNQKPTVVIIKATKYANLVYIN